MLTEIKGLHHVTSMAADAQINNRFFTRDLGLRRVKQTVNFDAPEVYHLYYGDKSGAAGTVMTYFPFPHIARGRAGTGEVSETRFSVPRGAIGYWQERLGGQGVSGLELDHQFGQKRLRFRGPDGDAFAMIEVDGDTRAPFDGGEVPLSEGIHGFHGVSMRLRETEATAELLRFLGYEQIDQQGAVTRFAINGNGADTIDLEAVGGGDRARQGAGSVHHVAFAVQDRDAQLRVRKALMDTGYHVTPVIDRDYFWAIYFRTPGGVLFEIATHDPGFERDEDLADLGQSLKLPRQHAHLRDQLQHLLPPLEA
ncbi:VOC family protein [Paracoccus sp. (in: a-proteobacteria)]|uniref:VOC family protein n=1 Tax=Paracoccus sp. TaxID=267 RepID=UPI0028976854|nr:VOC family protein [Paracoccus sp. (in: a-proteobacteria)]